MPLRLTKEGRRIAAIDDPVERDLALDAALDESRAKARGLRVRELTNLCVSALDGHGVLRDQDKARVIIWAVLAEALYGNAAVLLDNRKA